ncbi:MAG: CYTH domain-containing protein [Deltaproteobacteria bacterium]
MAKEIERKFRVLSDKYKENLNGVYCKQGYISTDLKRIVRVRINDQKAYITVKGELRGSTRAEYEYPIPVNDAEEMLEMLCKKPLIEKIRYKIDYKGFLWEVDEFYGENEGLIIAEIELDEEGTDFPKPEWLGKEVTDDMRYYNSNLIKSPYKDWKYSI